MTKLEWRSFGLTGKYVVIEQNRHTVGRLVFNPAWRPSAEYNSAQRKTHFISSTRLGSNISVVHNGAIKGEINAAMSSRQFLQLRSGKGYELTANLFGRKLIWRNEKGEPVIKFVHATLQSMGRGVIEISEELTFEERDILVSGGLVIRRFVAQRIAYLFYLLMLLVFAERLAERLIG